MSKESKIKIEELNTSIIKYRLHDKKNGAIIYYTLDLDKYQLSIQGEVNGSYKWCETPETESFLELMIRCNHGYLLMKLFERVFSREDSVKSIKRYVKDNNLFGNKNEERECLQQIADIYSDNPECFVREVFAILEKYDCNYDEYEVYCCLEKEYKPWDKKAISYFCNNIKPKLRKKLEEVK